MAPKVLDFKCALITGGAGGIGRAMAEYFISQGKTVIIAGRTLETLKTTSEELGSNVPYYHLDTSDIPSIESFVKKLTTSHPELDCLVNNAGVQRPLDVNKMDPKEFLEKADNELNTNIHGPMHLTLTCCHTSNPSLRQPSSTCPPCWEYHLSASSTQSTTAPKPGSTSGP